MSLTEPGGTGHSRRLRVADTAVTDQALMERIREGDRASLGMLIDRYWSPLVTYAAGVVGDVDVAQDVAQHCFIRVWQNRCDWAPRGAVKGYLFRITRNLAFNAVRDSRLRLEKQESGIGRRSPSPPTPEEELSASSLRAELEGALARLSKKRREVFVLSRFYGLTHREIAEALETSTKTVSNQIGEALDELRAGLSQHLEDI